MLQFPRRRTGAAIVLAAAVIATAMPSAGVARATFADRPQTTGDSPWISQLRIYARAIAVHTPGSADLSALDIGAWSEIDLDAARIDLLVLQSICRRGTGRARLPAGVVLRRESTGTSRDDAVALLGLDGAPDLGRALNLMLERGALLHADIAMLVTPFRYDNVGCSSRATVSVLDGQAVGVGCSNYHWRSGRALLDEVQPGPAAERFARLWYHATITFLLEQTNYSDALPQITQARDRFPDDGAVLFEHGYYQEALSAPRVQTLEGASRDGLSSAQTYLEAAESSFRRALKLDSGLVEARVRLGAVLTRLKHYREAVATLRPALEGEQNAVLRYFAELFLARAEEGMGDAPSARDHYERARAVMPSAEAPLLALGRLARSAGDRARAGDLVRRAIEARVRTAPRGDPWWDYNLWQSRNSATLLRELHQLITTGDRP